MIIVAENKTNHYLLKNFFKEISKVSLNESLKQNQAGEHTALDLSPVDLQDTVVDLEIPNHLKLDVVTDQPETLVSRGHLKRASKIKPKMNKLVSILDKGLKISAIAAAMYFSANSFKSEKAALDNIAQDNNTSVEKVIEKTKETQASDSFEINDDFTDSKLSLTDSEKSLNNARKTRQYDGEGIDYNTHPNSVYNFEGFRNKPYEDAGGMSIGYGTQLFTRYSDSQKTPWQKVFFEDKLKGKKSKSKKVVFRNNTLKKVRDITSITRDEARKAADHDIKERISDMFRIYPWLQDLPGDAQLAFLDMTYNMGLYFNMSGFKSNMQAASEQVKKGDFELAIEYLKTAKDELTYFKTPGQIEYEGSSEELKYSGYAVQGEKSVPVAGSEVHRRPRNSLQRLDDAIQTLQTHIDKMSIKENYSVKNIYKHLYS